MQVFSQNKKKGLKCSETKEYAKIFCDIFDSVSVKNISKYFLKILKSIFPLEPIFFLLSKSSFSGFSCSKTYLFIHVKKTCIKSTNSSVGGGRSRPCYTSLFFTCSLREHVKKNLTKHLLRLWPHPLAVFFICILYKYMYVYVFVFKTRKDDDFEKNKKKPMVVKENTFIHYLHIFQYF